MPARPRLARSTCLFDVLSRPPRLSSSSGRAQVDVGSSVRNPGPPTPTHADARRRQRRVDARVSCAARALVSAASRMTRASAKLPRQHYGNHQQVPPSKQQRRSFRVSPTAGLPLRGPQGWPRAALRQRLQALGGCRSRVCRVVYIDQRSSRVGRQHVASAFRVDQAAGCRPAHGADRAIAAPASARRATASPAARISRRGNATTVGMRLERGGGRLSLQ